jgi:hypothetical protein
MLYVMILIWGDLVRVRDAPVFVSLKMYTICDKQIKYLIGGFKDG